MSLLSSFPEQERRAAGEVLNSYSGCIIYEGTRTGAGAIKGARTQAKRRRTKRRASIHDK